MTVLEIPSADSTNAWVARNRDSLEPPTLVYALEQTAGRGQRGNSWEAQPGRNLTASLLCAPDDLRADHQFLLSEAVSLAAVDFFSSLGIRAQIKWPNDIYVGNRKIGGILIENSVLGRRIVSSIAGIGLNLNQETFLSDAPNPVSAIQITRKAIPVPLAAKRLCSALDYRLFTLCDPARLHCEYMQNLWRAKGFHKFSRRSDGSLFPACIDSIARDGILTLRTADGDKCSFAFKEVEFII